MVTDLSLALEKHDYRLAGQKLVNVTAISGLLDDGKSGAFAGAAVKLTKEGLNYRDEWKASGERGTRVHGHVESFLKGEAIDCLPSDMGYVDAAEKFMLDREPEAIELEEIVLSSEGYGGRFDIIAHLDGHIALIDVKTGKPYAVEHTLQLSAYRYAEGIAVYDEDGAVSGLRGMPLIERTYCLYLREDGSYDLREYPADEQAFAIFRGLLAAHRWTRTDVMKEAKK